MFKGEAEQKPMDLQYELDGAGMKMTQFGVHEGHVQERVNSILVRVGKPKAALRGFVTIWSKIYSCIFTTI